MLHSYKAFPTESYEGKEPGKTIGGNYPQREMNGCIMTANSISPVLPTNTGLMFFRKSGVCFVPPMLSFSGQTDKVFLF